MRSKASYQGHPLHPALIPFPFAFLTAAFVFDAAGWLFARSSWWTTGRYLAAAGILTALVAAVPGFIDYLYTVPPSSTAKSRATRHMLLNLAAVALVAIGWVLRQNRGPALEVIGLELIAVVFLSIAGWMGGVLVGRNQIGVDHRYADAGKWKEVTVRADARGLTAVAEASELAVNQMKLVRAGQRRLVLVRDEQGYAAIDDRCPHRGGSLAGGTMICGIVQCPWHGSQFDVRTGAVKAGPSNDGVRTYRVEERDGKVFLDL